MRQRYTGAVWDPISDRDRIPIQPRGLSIHTAVTNTSDLYGTRRGQGGTYAHFYNPKDGKLRQHQELDRMARADLEGNAYLISVENWDGYPNGYPPYWKHGGDVPPFTQAQVHALADLFAFLVKYCGIPNRIATPDNVTGLVWHRLGISGNFGRYDPKNRATWSREQTGKRFSTARGKLCPGDRRIAQIQEIYDLAQISINPKTASTVLAEIVKENDPMRNVGIHWKAKNGAAMYAILNPVSGFWAAHTTRNSGTYNNPLAEAFDTETWAPVTESHANVLRRACEAVRS